MADTQRQTARMTKVPYEYIFLFNYLGYPRINPMTFELEWWVYTDQYVAMTGESNQEHAEVNLDEVESGDLNTVTGKVPSMSKATDKVQNVSGKIGGALSAGLI